MSFDTPVNTIEPGRTGSSPRLHKLKTAYFAATQWLGAHLARNGPGNFSRLQVAAICAVIFLSALGVRLLYWQDGALELSSNDTLSQNMARQYRREARRMLEERSILFPRQAVEPGDAKMVIHPPGYSVVMAATFSFFGETESPLRWLQIICDALSSVLILLIAMELLPMAVAIIAAMLVALSPHAAYYSLRLSPDSLAVLPILLAVYFILRARQNPSVYRIAAAGLMLGASCWLRANAVLLAPVLAVTMLILFERRRRLIYSSVIVLVTVLVIAPISLRNWVVYHRFMPISLPAGVNLIQGIAEVDKEGRFGMPLSDLDVLKTDVEWNNRPDYGGHMWTPDGIERDRTRFARGIDVIKSHPLWYLGGILRRSKFMLSYNEAIHRDWPFNTATVPPVLTFPPFGHSISSSPRVDPISSVTAGELLEAGRALSTEAEISAGSNGDALRILGGGSEFEDQFLSGPFVVRKDTDYVLELPVKVLQGNAAARILASGGRSVLSTTIIGKSRQIGGRGLNDEAEITKGPEVIPFASGKANEVRLVLSNNGEGSPRSLIDVSGARLFEIGPTPTLWTHYPRLIVRTLEKSIYNTNRLVPLLLTGILILVAVRRWRTLVALLVVPAYYLGTHAPFSTEYRYILAIHYFLFVLAAVALYSLGLATGRAFSFWRWQVTSHRVAIDPGLNEEGGTLP